ncbi:MAG: hypothetical protein R3C16_08830 [Hyphomonadaceae bacterium]
MALAACAALLAAPGAASAQSLIRDAEIEDTLRVYATPLFEAADLVPDDVHIYIVNDPSLNAFVSGGKNVVRAYRPHHRRRQSERTDRRARTQTGHIAGGLAWRFARSDRPIHERVADLIGLGVLAIAAGALMQRGPDRGLARHRDGRISSATAMQGKRGDQAALAYLETSHQSGQRLLDSSTRTSARTNSRPATPRPI